MTDPDSQETEMTETPRPSHRRPNRAMSATGEITVTGMPLGPDRPVRYTLRQVGWLGQTGAFYDLDQKPSLTERGSFAPLYFIAHSDEIDTGVDDDRPADPTCCMCGKAADWDGGIWRTVRAGVLCEPCSVIWDATAEQGRRIAEVIEKRKAREAAAAAPSETQN